MRHNAKTITAKAKTVDTRSKALQLLFTPDNGDSYTLWLQKSKIEPNGDGTWTIEEAAYNKAMAEKEAYNARIEAQKKNLLTFAAGTFGLCKNGSYYLKTRGYSEGIDRPIKTDLAFVKPEHVIDNGDGTISINELAVNYAYDRAYANTQIRTNYACDTFTLVGLADSNN